MRVIICFHHDIGNEQLSFIKHVTILHIDKQFDL